MTDADLRVMARVLQVAAIHTVNNGKHDLKDWHGQVAAFRRWLMNLGIAKEGPGGELELVQLWRMGKARDLVKLRKCHLAGWYLQKSPIPTKLSEYKVLSEHFQTLLTNHTNPLGPNKESDHAMIKWAIRTHILAVLKSRGIPGLVMDEKTMLHFIKMFPDSKEWLLEVMRSTAFRTVREVCEYWDYIGHFELLTVFCYLFGEQAVLTTDLSILQKHARVGSTHHFSSPSLLS